MVMIMKLHYDDGILFMAHILEGLQFLLVLGGMEEVEELAM